MEWLAVVMALISQTESTPYVSGGDTPAGTDCSGLVSWVSNIATGRPTFGNRFHTGVEEQALRDRGFVDGTAPNTLVVGWNSYHTAVTLPDGTNVSSGERGGVRVGGGGAYQPIFTHHMYLPAPEPGDPPPLPGPPELPGPPPWWMPPGSDSEPPQSDPPAPEPPPTGD